MVAAPFGLALLSYGLWCARLHDRLPDPVATHFATGGGADGYLGRQAALWGGAAFLCGAGVLFCALAVRYPQRWSIALGGGLAALLGYLFSLTLSANADVTDASEAALYLWQLAMVLPIALLVGLICWLLAGPDEAPQAEREAAPALRLGPGESAVWSQAIASPVLWVVAGLLAALGLVLVAVPSARPVGVLMLLTAVLNGLFASLRVTVDGRGLMIASPLLPRPRLRVPMRRIEGAASREVRPLAEFGGYGYRVRPGKSGVVVRSGEALSARLRGGKEFVVTVDDAGTAAALLNGLLQRADGVRKEHS
ncbi:DUF1648 domain-containing protein [Streptomyces hoynatensis]|uniref:DUF1648 domain-containing protein n=1 Tax=Streptomyces hoynatensis TaxID=1141874 RepID=A0A3A9YSX3_9ACTN|nr:DUF1648 domain-containing protein [Streptomyces hoynatensis]